MRISTTACASIMMMAVAVNSVWADVADVQPGMIIAGSIRSGVGSLRVALPPGKWEVASTSDSFSKDEYFTPIKNVLLFRRDKDNFLELIHVRTPTGSEHSNGWKSNKHCNRNDMHYRKTVVNIWGRDQDCRWVNHLRMSISGSNRYAQYWRDGYSHISKSGLRIPRVMLVGGFNFANHRTFLYINYIFNPEAKGFPPAKVANWTTSDWHPDNIRGDKNRERYVKNLISWVDSFYPHVKTGFEGKLAKDFPPDVIVRTPESNASDYGNSAEIGKRLKTLQDLLDQGLISKDEYDQRRTAILNEL